MAAPDPKFTVGVTYGPYDSTRMTLFRVQSYGCTAWGWLPLMSHCWLRAACGTRNELELSPRRVVDWESRDAGYRDIPTSLPPPIAVAAQAVPARPACAHSDSR
eukprot:COSAG06_NODE_37600_length_433_cov_0.907186_1_plen_103_part_01